MLCMSRLRRQQWHTIDLPGSIGWEVEGKPSSIKFIFLLAIHYDIPFAIWKDELLKIHFLLCNDSRSGVWFVQLPFLLLFYFISNLNKYHSRISNHILYKGQQESPIICTTISLVMRLCLYICLDRSSPSTLPHLYTDPDKAKRGERGGWGAGLVWRLIPILSFLPPHHLLTSSLPQQGSYILHVGGLAGKQHLLWVHYFLSVTSLPNKP